MIQSIPQLHKKHVAILGLGKSGIASYRAVLSSCERVVVWDDGQQATDDITLLHYDAWPWESLDLIIMSPGVPYTHPTPHPVVKLAAQHHLRITCDVTLLMEACPDATVIGVTGTNGKSTTTALINHCLREQGMSVACGGNIGTPALALPPLGADGVYVLELSSYQLDLMDAGVVNIACLLNISPDHLDRHGGLEGYIAAKQRIFARQTSDDKAIIAVDDGYTQHITTSMPGAMCVSAQGDAGQPYYMDEGWLVDASCEEERRIDMRSIATLQGQHNHQNALIAYAACRVLDISADDIYHAMMSFPGLEHRMERIADISGVTFINDSKATNADAASKSLGTYEHIFWILGGVAKDGGITSLTHYFPRVTQAFCIGQSADTFADTLQEHEVAYQHCVTLEKAVSEAYRAACDAGGGVVLLAPAAASFDQFQSFEARGDAFRQLVHQIAGAA